MERNFLETFLDQQLTGRDCRSFYLRALEKEGWDVPQLLIAVANYLKTPASRRTFDIDMADRDVEPRLVVRRQPVLAA